MCPTTFLIRMQHRKFIDKHDAKHSYDRFIRKGQAVLDTISDLRIVALEVLACEKKSHCPHSVHRFQLHGAICL